MTSGTIFDIKRYAINDGPGIRTAVFLKGCPLNCWWCHNPEGQAMQPQLMFRSNRCKSTRACLDVCTQQAITWNNGSFTDWEKCDDCGKCAEVCFTAAREMVGRDISLTQLISELERDVPFYDQSGGGVTFTGGEPFYQMEFLNQALNACKAKQIHTAVDTSGLTRWENIKVVLPLVDLFLYDLKLMNDDKHIQYTGASNKLILSNLSMLSLSGAHIIVRFPLIPGINDDQENYKSCAVFLSNLPSLEGVEFMPYHDIGVAKYDALGMEYKANNIKTPGDEQITQAEEFFSSYQIHVIKHSGRS